MATRSNDISSNTVNIDESKLAAEQPALAECVKIPRFPTSRASAMLRVWTALTGQIAGA